MMRFTALPPEFGLCGSDNEAAGRFVSIWPRGTSLDTARVGAEQVEAPVAPDPNEIVRDR